MAQTSIPLRSFSATTTGVQGKGSYHVGHATQVALVIRSSVCRCAHGKSQRVACPLSEQALKHLKHAVSVCRRECFSKQDKRRTSIQVPVSIAVRQAVLICVSIRVSIVESIVASSVVITTLSYRALRPMFQRVSVARLARKSALARQYSSAYTAERCHKACRIGRTVFTMRYRWSPAKQRHILPRLEGRQTRASRATLSSIFPQGPP